MKKLYILSSLQFTNTLLTVYFQLNFLEYYRISQVVHIYTTK